MGADRSRAIDDNLFDWPAAAPALKASRCRMCGNHAFPTMSSCRYCGGTDVEVVALPRQGTLWTWTVQHFMPKAPYRSSETEATFRPYGMGYVELPGALRIETRLTESDPSKLRIGAPVELVIYTHSGGGRRDRSHELRIPTDPGQGSASMRVAIVGIGIHQFGRTPGSSGLQQGAYAARRALEDAGSDGEDIQFAYGGSYSAGNADALGNELGLTGHSVHQHPERLRHGRQFADRGLPRDPRPAQPTSDSSSASTSTIVALSTRSRRNTASATGTARPA